MTYCFGGWGYSSLSNFAHSLTRVQLFLFSLSVRATQNLLKERPELELEGLARLLSRVCAVREERPKHPEEGALTPMGKEEGKHTVAIYFYYFVCVFMV